MVIAFIKYKMVLRLKKRDCQDLKTLKSNDSLRGEETVRNLNFAKMVLSPLMGDKYVHFGNLVSIPQGFAEAMNEICRGKRPQHRINKVIDESCAVGVLMPDFCFLPQSLIHHPESEKESSFEITTPYPTLSVELKPKCGFLPVSPLIDSARTVKYFVCTYCMLQKLKVKEGKYSRESTYCPLDLFSRDCRRVKKSLKGLVSDPQNNLRVFKDGQAIFTEELVQEAIKERKACCVEKFFEMSLEGTGAFNEEFTQEAHECGALGSQSRKFLEILLRVFIDDSHRNEEIKIQNVVDHSPQICQRSKNLESKIENVQGDNVHSSNVNFGKGGVLQRLLFVQKLDDIDVEGIRPLYNEVIKYFERNQGTRSMLGVDGPYTSPLWTSVASSLTDTAQTFGKNVGITSTPSSKNLSAESLDLSNENCLYNTVLKICKFAVAGTAKDCSVMIAFQRTLKRESSLPSIVEPFGSDIYQYNINLVDLDPKEFDRVVKYFKDSIRVVENYLT